VVKTRFYKFGRFSAWFFLQHLHHTAGIPNVPSSLLLNDFAGSKSHRNGLLMALGMDDKYDQRLTATEYDYLECESRYIMTEMIDRFPQLTADINPYTMETALCAFKKIFRTKHGRYLGYYNDRVSEEIKRVEKDDWSGIEWNVLWQARQEELDSRLSSSKVIQKGRFGELMDTGNVDRLDWMFAEDTKVEFGLEGFM